MVTGIFKKFFDPEKKELKKLEEVVAQVASFEAAAKALPLEKYPEKMDEFRARLKQGETLDDILPECYAYVREAAWQTVDMRPFDVQIMGATVLHQGRICEMKTGEGKTLVCTLPIVLNALTGKGVHLVTVNDYLAKRDAEWMAPLYNAMGLTVGALQNDMRGRERREIYQMDITYGTNSEFGFDYLRDNMVVNFEDMVQRGMHYAIVDEVDSVLIDEARTPLIISGSLDKDPGPYMRWAQVVKQLRGTDYVKVEKGEEDPTADFDYTVDRKDHAAVLTEKGQDRVEQIYGGQIFERESEEEGFDENDVYTDVDFETRMSHQEDVQLCYSALKARALYRKDVEYVIKDGEIIIVDEHTGRLMPGRRFAEGLHQAIEAKEGVQIKSESQTLATITIQNYFRMYDKMSGMTGTAKTEEEEFREIYACDVVVIPTNLPLAREDHDDVIFKTEEGKYKAVVEEIKEVHEKGQPILVGTSSVEKSELLSRLLIAQSIPHEVLNAKNHEREADIVKDAGQPGRVTISTAMAGRGTDIKLGEGVTEAGGLYVLGTERHESRRIDNQLRGRSGRQGDPGVSRYVISLEDELMKTFMPPWVGQMMERLGFSDSEPIEHARITKAIETAQKRKEQQNFESRKWVLKYDDVMERQRSVVYHERRKMVRGENIKPVIMEFIEQMVQAIVEQHYDRRADDPDYMYQQMVRELQQVVPVRGIGPEFFTGKSPDEFTAELAEIVKKLYDQKEELVIRQNVEAGRSRQEAEERMRHYERWITLTFLDESWIEHLYSLDALREGISLRSFAQVEPVVAYTKESYELYVAMWDELRRRVLSRIFSQLTEVEDQIRAQAQKSRYRVRGASSAGSGAAPGQAKVRPVVKKQEEKVGRNDPCPCGSGKKYKKCCGKND